MRKISVVRNIASNGIDKTTLHNEAVDLETALTLTGYGKFHLLLMLASLPGVMTNVFDTSAMSYVLPSAVCDLHLSSLDKGLLNSITYAGMISSAFMWGFLSDSLGRQRLLCLGFFLDVTCGVISSFSQNFQVLVVFRFFSGFIISGPHAMLISFLAEFHSHKYRARMIILTGVYGALANISIPGLAWLIIPQSWSWSLFGGHITYNSWRVFVAVCTIPSFLAGCLMTCFDESPKFLMSRGQTDEALRVLRKVYSINTGKHPDTYPVKALLSGRIETQSSKVTLEEQDSFEKILTLVTSGWKQVKPLFRLPHITSAILVFSIQFGALLSMNTIRLWMPQLFFIMEDFAKLQEDAADSSLDGYSLCEMLAFSKQLERSKLNQSAVAFEDLETCTVNVVKSTMYLNSVIVGGVTGVFYLFAGSIINAMGRKRMLILGFLVATVCVASIYWSRNSTVTIAIIAVYLAASSVTGKAVVSVVVDLFPTSLRAMAVSLTMMFGRSGALLGNLLFPILLDLSCSVPFFVVSGVTFAGACLSALLPIHLGKNAD
ncbi:synaptic vesicle glycoprotein 2B-like isoform X2 [Bacillus rossius redtenbacheri]|uniref:synaptic vesicle glycoprotein 2B-like isoform X2 n=1 Tax=Bacillus rossius redtenbacheri TaxID=93214 RepID=UPI002FDDAAF6